jgi:hypothetical protein
MMEGQRAIRSGTQVPSTWRRADLQERWTSMSIDLWRTRRAANPLNQVIDQMFEQTFVPYDTAGLSDGGSTGFQSLPVNVWETDDGYHGALAGASKVTSGQTE